MIRKPLFLVVIFLLVCGCTAKQKEQPKQVEVPKQNKVEASETKATDISKLQEEMSAKYQGQQPQQWGEKVPGVISKLDTEEKVVALTFDACGSGGASSQYNQKLINFLNEQKIPATLFINSRWIDANQDTFKQLAANPLFEIENHGYLHKPLSVSGKSVYGIKGTADIKEVVNEVELNASKIKELTGRKPQYFRSGTAYYDDIAVKVVRDLGYQPVNFNVLGDAGATFSKDQVRQACLSAKPGSILIFHMNHPESGTADGVMMGVSELQKRGYRFVKLEGHKLL